MLTWLLLALLLSVRVWVISASASHLRRSPAHLRVLASHLGVTRSHLRIARHLIHRVRLARMASGSAHLAGVRFRLVSAHVSSVPLLSGFEVVAVCAGFSCAGCLTRSCALKITFGYVPRSSFPGSRSCSSLALTSR